MANVFLNAGETRPGFLAPNDTVFGNTGTEGVTINTGATNVRVEGTVEIVTLPGAPSAFTYQAQGNNLIVYSGGVAVARIIVQDDANGTVINFNGGSVTANVGAGGLTLGGTVVPTTAGGSEVVPGDFDETAELSSALNDLRDAQDARDEFLASEEADLDENPDTVTTEAELEVNLETLQAELADMDTAAQLDAAVAVEEADLAAVQARVDAVSGLNEAIDDYRAAVEDLDAAEDTLDRTGLEVELAGERYEELNETSLSYIQDEDGNVTVFDADDNVILETDGDTIVLGEGINETRNPGVTQLLAAVRDYVPAVEAYIEAGNAFETAETTLNLTDVDPASLDEREDLTEFRAATEAYETALAAYVAGNAPSEAALVAAYDNLVEAGASDVIGAPDGTSNADYAAAIDTNSDDIGVEITETEGDFEDAVEAADVTNPIYDALVGAEQDLSEAQDAVDNRADLVERVADAQDLVDQLDALNGDVEAATAAIVDLGYETPTVLGEDASVRATARNDIFLATGEDAQIARFGAAGDDLLFLGSGLTLVELEASDEIGEDAVGSATRLEAFIQQDGSNTVIYVEEQAFQGSEEDGTFDGYTITLTNVQASTVSFDSGYISIA